MPNYFANRLTIEGNPLDLSVFIGDNEDYEDDEFGGTLALHKSVPPTDLQDGGAREEAWGVSYIEGQTKWEERAHNRYEIFFDSPWGPPYVWIDAVIKKYPRINFELLTGDIGEGAYIIITGKKGRTKDFDLSKQIPNALNYISRVAAKEKKRNPENYFYTTKNKLYTSQYAGIYVLLEHYGLFDSYIEGN